MPRIWNYIRLFAYASAAVSLTAIVFAFVSVPGVEASPAEYHVSTAGSDSNSGTAASPFRTIQKAADTAAAGDTVIVHGGIYREFVRPQHSGTESARITYKAADGEHVSIRGSNVYDNWVHLDGGVWSAALNPAQFENGFNPYTTALVKKTNRTLGQLFLDGVELNEADGLSQVDSNVHSWKVSNDGLTIYVNFGDTLPNEHLVEVTMRKQLFAPDDANYGKIHYITVDGFYFSHSATQFHSTYNEAGGTEMRGAVDTLAGHDWIIENNTIRDVKTTAIMLGIGSVDMFRQLGGFTADYGTKSYTALGRVGHHIVRNNYIERAGSNGITGRMSPFTQITGNSIIECNYLLFPINNMTGGIKVYDFFDAVIQGNYFLNNYYNSLWADVNNNGIRITQNVFVNEHDSSLVFFELSHGPALADSNVFINNDVKIYDVSGTRVVHNLFYNSKAYVDDWSIRTRPVFLPHTAEIGTSPNSQSTGIRNNKLFNNLVIKGPRAGSVDIADEAWSDDNASDYNVFLQGAVPSRFDENSAVSAYDTGFSYTATRSGASISFSMNSVPWSVNTPLITSAYIGLTPVTRQGIDVTVDRDFYNNPLPTSTPLPGPFANLQQGTNSYVLWQKPDRTVLLVDSFDGNAAGTTPSGWSASNPAHVVAANVPSSSDKSMKLTSPVGASVSTTVYRPFASRTAGTVTAQFGFSLVQTSHSAELGTLLSSSGTVAASVYYDAGQHKLLYTDGSVSAVLPGSPSPAPGEWHSLKLNVHPETGRYDIYVDDMTQPAVVSAALSGGVKELSELRFALQPASGSEGVLYINNAAVLDSSFFSADLDQFQLSGPNGTIQTSPAFAPSVTHYEATVPYGTSSAHLTWATTTAVTSVSLNGSVVSVQPYQATVPLNAGLNTIELDVNAIDGSHKIYIIQLTRLNQNVLFSENFNSRLVGQTPDGWNTTPSGLITVADSPGLRADRSLQLLETVANASNVRAVREFTPVSGGTLSAEFSFKLNSAGSNVNLGYISNAASEYATALFFEAATNKLKYYDGGTTYDLPGGLDLDLSSWHRIKLVLNMSNQTYDIYLDDLATPRVSQAVFRAAVGSVERIVFQMNNHASVIGSMRIDNVHVETADTSYSNYLSGLAVTAPGGSSIPLDRSFITAATTYTATVTSTVSSVRITPAAEHASAAITVNGTAATSGTPSAEIPLQTGWNTVQTVVYSAYRPSNVYQIYMYKLPAAAPALFDSFNGGTTGLAPAGWNVTDSSLTTVAAQPGAGNLSMHIASPAGSVNQRAYRTFSSASSGTVRAEFKAYIDKVGGNMNLGYIGNSSGDYATTVFLNASTGILRYYNGGSSYDLPLRGAMPANSWVRFKYVVDMNTQKYDIYVEDMTTPVVAGASFRTALTSVNRITFQLNTSASADGSAYFDDLLIEK